jgi:hypothetical protein
MLTIENSSLATTYPDVWTALILNLTLPITVAAAERSFSKQKIIKMITKSDVFFTLRSIASYYSRKFDYIMYHNT